MFLRIPQTILFCYSLELKNRRKGNQDADECDAADACYDKCDDDDDDCFDACEDKYPNCPDCEDDDDDCD